MPLPQFLLTILLVAIATVMTLWASVASGISLLLLALVILSVAAVLHLSISSHRDQDG
ncbi:hypothetical protein [Paracoccus sp. (in: a-proteobacteria)]|uniref:hypothetical protein n=1 Tax=Paracoccus sp. TaxID=267 RepID=UPI003A8AC4EE